MRVVSPCCFDGFGCVRVVLNVKSPLCLFAINYWPFESSYFVVGIKIRQIVCVSSSKVCILLKEILLNKEPVSLKDFTITSFDISVIAVSLAVVVSFLDRVVGIKLVGFGSFISKENIKQSSIFSVAHFFGFFYDARNFKTVSKGIFTPNIFDFKSLRKLNPLPCIAHCITYRKDLLSPVLCSSFGITVRSPFLINHS